MVKSSIVIPATTDAHKRSIADVEKEEIKGEEEEAKRPRLALTEAGAKRSKRLFGVLLNTLTKFKDDTQQTSQVDKNRKEINDKLHEKLEKEKQEMFEKSKARKEEREKMFEMKTKEKNRLQEEKRELFQVEQMTHLSHYLKTETKPCLYYLPKKLTQEMETVIENQQKEALEARKKYEDKREARMEETEGKEEQ
ncbi:hypothetical protein K501DRAFT_289540 [Backusella circina FSU 941]|nr:hypothetical protein K501DRAFT_289540 [Backusella circina FSU 941]